MSYAVLTDAPRRLAQPIPRRGLGASGAQVAGSAFTTATDVTATILAATGVGAPIAAVVAAIGAIGGPIIGLFSGCGQTCVQATQYANQAATAVQQIHDTYFAQPVRYKSMQQAALSQVQQIIDALKQACGNPALGKAGQDCITDRLIRGGPTSWCPKPGKIGCDWYTTIYDPIANDPGVVPDPSPVSSLLGSSTSGGSVLPLVMAGVLVLGLVYAL